MFKRKIRAFCYRERQKIRRGVNQIVNIIGITVKQIRRIRRNKSEIQINIIWSWKRKRGIMNESLEEWIKMVIRNERV